MAQVEFDGIEPGFDRQGRPFFIVVGDAGDVGLGDGPGHLARGSDPAGRRQRRHTVGPRVGDGAGVAQLGGGRRPLGVDGIGEAPQAGHGVVTEHDPAPTGPSLRADGQVGHGGHPHAAGGDADVVVDQGVGDLTSGGGALESGGLDDPVAQRDGTEPHRLEGHGSHEAVVKQPA